MKPVDPATLRRGDLVRFGGAKGVFQFRWYEERRPGQMRLVCYGPIGSPFAVGGLAFYVGPRPTSKVDLVTGRRVRLVTLKVRLADIRREL